MTGGGGLQALILVGDPLPPLTTHPSQIMFLQTPSHLPGCIPSSYKYHGRGEVFDLTELSIAIVTGALKIFTKPPGWWLCGRSLLDQMLEVGFVNHHAWHQEWTRSLHDIKDISCVCKSCMFAGEHDVRVARNTQTDVCVHAFYRQTPCMGAHG